MERLQGNGGRTGDEELPQAQWAEYTGRLYI